MLRSADSGQGTWNRGVSKEKVSFHRDLVPGISVSVVDGPRVSLDPVIELRPSACLRHIKEEMNELERNLLVLFSAVPQKPCLAHREGAQWPSDEEIRTRIELQKD